MTEEIIIVGVKQYFEIIEGTKTLISTENVEISTEKNNPLVVAFEYENIQSIQNSGNQ
tara:strand:- start:156 stop:329 length:174 start_codon:yes stop_codon:yes gene_type:complete